MKKSIIIFCAVVLMFCLWLLLHQKAEPVKSSSSNIQTPTADQQAANQVPITPTEPAQNPNVPKPPPDLVAEAKYRSTPEGSNAFRQKILTDWQTPIEFYGKVIDENSNAVMGAKIGFQWVETPYEEGSQTANTESDVEGLFSLHGKRGPSLEVWVGKEGYYASHHGQWGFAYADSNEKYMPDSSNPVVFLLHKKGQGAELITSENGMQLNVSVRIPKDSTPIRVDLIQKQPSASGQLEISQNKPPWQAATNWSFRMSIPDGGLAENQDEFQFAAPESGYQPTVEYDFTKGETNWTTQVTKQFYIAFGQPRKYGWLRIESNLAQETVFLTYAINPTGSHNLEATTP